MATTFEDTEDTVSWGDATACEFCEALAFVAERMLAPADPSLLRYLRTWGALSVRFGSPTHALAEPGRLARLAEVLTAFASALAHRSLPREAWPDVHRDDSLRPVWIAYALRIHAMIDRVLGRDDAWDIPAMGSAHERDALEFAVLTTRVWRSRSSPGLTARRLARAEELARALGQSDAAVMAWPHTEHAQALEHAGRYDEAAAAWRHAAQREHDAVARSLALEAAAQCEAWVRDG